MTEVFRKYSGGEPRPDDKAPIACTVRHPEAGGQCEREAIGEVWALPFCEVHGKEAELAYLEELQETIAYGLDMLRDDGRNVLQQLVAEALTRIEYPARVDGEAVEAAMREAYPPEELEQHINPDILAYDYKKGFMVGDGPYDWWCEARLMVLRFCARPSSGALWSSCTAWSPCGSGPPSKSFSRIVTLSGVGRLRGAKQTGQPSTGSHRAGAFAFALRLFS